LGIFHDPNPIWGIFRPSLSVILWKGILCDGDDAIAMSFSQRDKGRTTEGC
jgi:hypothetical protein